jgi:hypothetical protein
MGNRVKPGNLVKVIDPDPSRRIAPAPESIGLVVSIATGETCPNAVDVLLFDGTIICEWEDELEVINV